uniref:Maturin n=1 Tax=Paramormyrops kingsleyae TaxID=1676925 RepID=A0A3B3QD43_9TELE
MEFKQLVDTAEKWCAGNPFDLIFAEEFDERRLDFYAEPGISFYVLCPDNVNGGADNFHVWSESEDCLPFLQLAQDYISSCGKKTLLEILDKVLRSFRPVSDVATHHPSSPTPFVRFMTHADEGHVAWTMAKMQLFSICASSHWFRNKRHS